MFGFFFFNDTATTEIYTLSLHDALPIYSEVDARLDKIGTEAALALRGTAAIANARLAYQRFEQVFGSQRWEDRKSTRLNSSHANISYAVFCLKKKKKKKE